MIQQQPGGQQRLLMMQPTQVMSGPPTPSTPTQPSAPVYGSPQRASPPGTTSDDSDDSVPSQHSQVTFILSFSLYILNTLVTIVCSEIILVLYEELYTTHIFYKSLFF